MTSYIVRSSSEDGNYGSFSTQDAAERALSMVTRKMDPNAYIVASLDWQDRALAAGAEVERLTAELADRDQRIEAALGMLDAELKYERNLGRHLSLTQISDALRGGETDMGEWICAGCGRRYTEDDAYMEINGVRICMVTADCTRSVEKFTDKFLDAIEGGALDE